jgi:RNA polymerase sigma factor (sigma-70 family)
VSRLIDGKSTSEASVESETDTADTRNTETRDNDEVVAASTAEAASLRLYLREIRALPRLPREREVELAKRREAAEARGCAIVLSTRPALEHLLRRADELRCGEIQVDQVLECAFEGSESGRAEKQKRACAEFLRRTKRLKSCIAGNRGRVQKNAASDRSANGALELLGDLRLRRVELALMGDALKTAWRELTASERSEASCAVASINKVESRTGLTAHELTTLVESLQATEREAAEAKRLLVEANLQLVVGIAKRYRRSGLALSDLIQEGNLGLMRAAQRFDYRLGCRFATYATWWIRQSIGRSIINFGGMIRVPVQLVEARHKLYRAEETLTRSLGRLPSSEELAHGADLPVRIVETILRLPQPPLSLHTPVAPAEEKGLEYYVEDRRVEGPGERALGKLALTAARRHLAILTPRQQSAVRHRFGIEMERDYTLQEIGDIFSITRERARQIETQALRRLRAGRRGKVLRDSDQQAPLPARSRESADRSHTESAVGAQPRKKVKRYSREMPNKGEPCRCTHQA